jgi:glycosyltransferase involved in cell wall biosynthesis
MISMEAESAGRVTDTPVRSTGRTQVFSILHTERSKTLGGQEQRIILECRKLMALGHRVVIACQPGSAILKKAGENGIPAEAVTMRGQFDLRAIRDIYRIIRKYGITVVNTHSSIDNWIGSLAARIAGVPLLVRTRHHPVPISNSPLNFVHKLADGFTATGEAVRTMLVTDNRIPVDRVISVPTGVSLERFSPGIDPLPVKRQLGIDSATRVVTMVGRLRSGKRYDLFVEAAALVCKELADVRFLVVGDGAGEEMIRQKIAEHDLEKVVLMTGYRADIPEIMASSDIVVLASDSEGVPQVLTQAMAMERPVVAFPVGGIPDLIEDGVTGLFADAGNARSFADKILMLLRDDSLCRTLGSAARQHVLTHFSDDTMVEKTVNFYQYLLDLKQRGTAVQK